jgi:cytochrome c5
MIIAADTLQRGPARTALVTLILAAMAGVAQASEDARDPTTGLIIAPGWELVSAHCGACHSHALVTAQRGDADFWRSTIRWMQKTQNLWQIPEPQEAKLIEYLATHYNETDWGRRPPLPRSLLPDPPAE